MSAKAISEQTGKEFLYKYISTSSAVQNRFRYANVTPETDWDRLTQDHPWLLTEVTRLFLFLLFTQLVKSQGSLNLVSLICRTFSQFVFWSLLFCLRADAAVRSTNGCTSLRTVCTCFFDVSCSSCSGWWWSQISWLNGVGSWGWWASTWTSRESKNGLKVTLWKKPQWVNCTLYIDVDWHDN